VRPALEVADIFRRHGATYRAEQAGSLSRGQRRVMAAIEACRTAALGGHVESCEGCGETRIAYNSCRNRHCPKCQGLARAQWLADRQSELLPVPYLHLVFTMPAPIAAIALQNKAAVYDLLSKAADTLRRTDWVVYAKRPFGGPQQVLDYLGRHTHRVAIANSRLLDLADGQVRFRWTDYRHPERPKAMTLQAGEFIRRFLLHVLPDGFRRIRHFGFLANAHRRAKLALIRRLLDVASPTAAPEAAGYRERYALLTGRSLDICPSCGGRMIETASLRRAPKPLQAWYDSS
jgi:putative transposase/transposase-like zinc-binding protein